MDEARAGWREGNAGKRPRWRRVSMTTAVVGLLVLAMAAPAWASATVSTTGSRASYDSPSNVMSVSDTLADGETAYALYCWSNSSSQTSCSSPRRLENFDGAGSTVRFLLSPAGSRIVFRACRNVTLAPDNCSSYVNTNS